MYGVDTEFGIVLGILVSVGFIVYAVLLIKRPLNFGDYKEFFEKMHKLKYNYYLVAIIFRFLIVLGICVFNESLACTYFTISICLIQVLVLAVLRPY